MTMTTRRLPFLLVALLLVPAGHATSQPADQAPEARADVIARVLSAGLASEEPFTRAWALRASAASGQRDAPAAALRELDNANPTLRLGAALALVELGQRLPQAHAALTRLVVEADAQERAWLLEGVLAHLPEASRVAVLRDSLRGAPDVGSFRQMIRHIASQGGSAELALLDPALLQADAERRRAGVQVLSSVRRASLEDAAARLIRQRDVDARRDGADILMGIATPSARSALAPLLRDPDADLAQRVGFFLAAYGEAPALERVRDIVLRTDADEDLRRRAMERLRDGGPQLLSFQQALGLVREEGRSAAFTQAAYELLGATASEQAIGHLLAMLDSNFADDRILALHGLGYARQPSLEEVFRGVVRSQGVADLRAAGMMAMGRLRTESAAEELAERLRFERTTEQRVVLVRALGETGVASAAQAIVLQLARRDDPVSMAAIDALVQLGNPEVRREIESAAQTYRTPEVRWRAVVALMQLDPVAGRERLMQMLARPPAGFERDLADLSDELRYEIDVMLITNPDTAVRDAALARVRSREDGGWAALRRHALSAAQADVRRQALHVVLARGDREDLQTLQELATNRDRQIRHRALEALGRLNDESLGDFYAQRLTDTDVPVRLISVWALHRIGQAQ